jgi:hypothetical protein
VPAQPEPKNEGRRLRAIIRVQLKNRFWLSQAQFGSKPNRVQDVCLASAIFSQQYNDGIFKSKLNVVA